MSNNVTLGYFRVVKLILVGICALHAALLWGSTPHDVPNLHFRQIKDGLSQSNTRCIVEDHTGYIWVGTWGGLNRYDGQEVRVFESNDADSSSIPDNRINDLLLDSRQNLWIASFLGLTLYVEELESFRTFKKDFGESKEKHLDALTLFEDKNARLWIGTNHGLHVMDSIEGGIVRPEQTALKALELHIVHAIEAWGEQLLFGTNKGLFAYHPERGSLIELISQQGQSITGEILDLLHDRNGQIWVATNHEGLYKIHQGLQGQWLFEHFYHSGQGGLNDPRISSLCEDSQGRIWVGTESLGLNLYLPKEHAFKAYTQNLSEDKALKSNSVWEIFEDKMGRLYIGSNNQGFFIHDPYAINFNHVDSRYGHRLKFPTVSAFLEVGNDMWIGTDGGGISIWNRETDTYSFLLHDEEEPNSLASKEVITLFQDSKGIIWSGNWKGGLNKYEPTTNSFHTYKKNESKRSIGSNSITSIQEDADGNLWMTSWDHGISRYNRATDDFFNIGYIPHNDHFLAHRLTCDLEIDDQTGEIWVASVLGLDQLRMLDDTSFTIKRYAHDDEDECSLSAENAQCLFEDSQHRLWVGTKDGLNLLNRETGTFTRFYTYDGLPSNDIRDIIQDDQQTYWVTTKKGLAKMVETAVGFIIHSYQKEDGLQADEFFKNASYKASNGEIFVGGVNGFNHFDPSAFKLYPYAPSIQFTDFKLFNRKVDVGGTDSILSAHINSVEHLSLKKKHSAFSIDFVGIDMTQPQKHEYAYKLEGFDPHWNYIEDDLHATYTNLNAGEYTFLVNVANRDGIYNEQPRALKITILPPWWEQDWAQFLFILAHIMVVVVLVQLRFSMIKNQKRKLAQKVSQQTEILTRQKNEMEAQAQQLRKANMQKDKLFSIISHDLRSPLYSLQGITKMLNPEILSAKDLPMIRGQMSSKIENLSKVMLNLLEWSSSQLAGETSRIEDVDISILIDEICLMYQAPADEKNISLLNSISKPLFVRADENQLRIVIRNLIGNALKFTPSSGQVIIRSEILSAEDVLICVSDTGMGMSQQQVDCLFDLESRISSVGTAGEKGVGLGLLLVKEYVEKNGGEICVESEQGRGTCFRFTLGRV